MSIAARSRSIPCEGVFNLRDLGGLLTRDGATVRHNRVFRADGLHRVPAEAVPNLTRLGWRTVIDLRTRAEVELGCFSAAGVDVVHLPVLQSTWDSAALVAEVGDAVTFLTRRYLEMTSTGGRALAGAFSLLADDTRLPAVFHCSAGKDRTGVLAALLLAALGVPDDDIAADYADSAAAMEGLVAWLLATRPDAAEEMARQPAAFLACPPAAMTAFLAEVRNRFGSIESYLCGVGAGPSVLRALRENLLID